MFELRSPTINALLFLFTEYFSFVKRRKEINCNWKTAMSNTAELNDIDKNMNLIFEKTKQLKNIVKFTNLENNRNSEELHFIRHHLNGISEAIKINKGDQLLETKKEAKRREKNQLEFSKSRKNFMPNGYTYPKNLRYSFFFHLQQGIIF